METTTNGSRHDRKRSRSPYHERRRDEVKRHRSRSPHRKHHHHHHRHERKERSAAKPVLPFHARSLHKDDFEQYEPLLAEYLDVQKRLNIDDLEEREVKGRWKSFIRKWCDGELAEGWYDPDMKSRVDERWMSRPPTSTKGRAVPGNKLLPSNAEGREDQQADEDDEDDDDDFGPAPPSKAATRYGAPAASLQDLQHRRELAEEDDHARLQDFRYQRKADRAEQQERAEELAPRADPGSRERKLEKKSETTSALNQFREAKEAGDVEVNDNDLMGGGDDGAEGYKKRRQEMERKKGEREIRKEEALRARMAEREERLQVQREKEEKTMANLKAIAKARFG